MKRINPFPTDKVNWLLQRTGEGLLHFLRFTHNILPRRAFEGVIRALLSILVRFAFPRRRILKNIKRAFGETYSDIAKKGLAGGVQHHLARNMQDCFQQLLEPSYAASNVHLTGLEHLEAALAKQKGVIALGAHLGNFPLVGARLGSDGFPFHVLFRVPSDHRIRNFIHENVSLFHQTIISSQPRRTAVKTIITTLRKNGIVFMLADNLKRGEITTRLFGQTVRSPRGPASLALRSGAALLPVYVVRNYRGDLELVIEPEIPLHRTSDLNTDILHNTHLITAHLETIIRLYPDQWMWLTVRMKRRQPPYSDNHYRIVPPDYTRPLKDPYSLPSP